MRIVLIHLLTCILFAALGQSRKNEYQFTIDLTTVVDDKVKVDLVPPPIINQEVVFHLAKIIPGTYAVQDYGRFVSVFEARDNKGALLPVVKIDTNSWKITGAKNMASISYWIEDSFDTKLGGPVIFWPAGTNIENEKNFVINPGGFFGYFEGMKQIPFKFNVIRDKSFYGTTGLIPLKVGESLAQASREKGSSQEKKVDIYQAENFDRLVDSPLMYAKPDTALIKVAHTEVLIGVYSPNKKISAREIAGSVREVLMAQKEYLGGTLPVEKYAFIFYFTDQTIMSYGALEHSYSSFYFMPEASIDRMRRNMRDFAAHEFFHIVTPLNIHSEEIGHFDFDDPKMSQHLWLYEGVTEYFSGNMQVKYGLISPEQYLSQLQQKLLTADRFKDDLPFTELSKNVLDKYEDQFYNVYQKGALIGLCLDIKLRQLSDGKYGLQNLIAELSAKYGKDKSFKDDELFAEIGKLTYAEIEEFMNTYVAGASPLPLVEILSFVGVDYQEQVDEKTFNLGFASNNISSTQYNEKMALVFTNTYNLSDQGRLLGIEDGDILVKINDEPLPSLGKESSEIIAKHKAELKEGGKLSLTVMRPQESGEYLEMRLEADVRPVITSRRHVMNFTESPTGNQLKLKQGWLTPH